MDLWKIDEGRERIERNALKAATVALKADIADFDPGRFKEAQMVCGFVDQKQSIDDAIRGLIDEPIEHVPRAERAWRAQCRDNLDFQKSSDYLLGLFSEQ